MEFAAYLLSRCDIDRNGKTPTRRLHGRKDNTPILELDEKILKMPAEDTTQESPAQDPALSICYSLTTYNLPRHHHSRKFKVTDGAQNTIMAREMMQNDIKRELMSGLMKLDEIMEKLEIIIHGMIADDGTVEMDLVNLGTHDARTTQCDQDANNDMSYDDVCVCDRVERI